MCCHPSKEGEEKVNEMFGKKKTAIFWKVLDVPNAWEENSGEFILEGLCTCYVWKCGYNIAYTNDGLSKIQNNPLPEKYKYRPSVPRGIHVYFSPAQAKSFNTSSRIMVPVVCHKKDFLVADEGQAVFRKVLVTNKAWKEHVETKLKRLEKLKKED